MKPGPLDLSAQEFRGLADRVLDDATLYLDRLDTVPIRPASTGAQTVELFAGPPPETGLGAAALDDLRAVAQTAGPGTDASSATSWARESRWAPWGTSSLP